MAESVASLVSSVKSEASFDVSDQAALAWLNRRYKRMVTRARALRKTYETATVTNQRDYELPSDLIELDEVSVNGLSYGLGVHRDLLNGAQGYLVLGGIGGLVTAEESSSGDPEIALFPTPTEDGNPILIRGFFEPSDLELTDSVSLVPAEYIDALINGAVATGLKRQEYRPDLAAPLEQEYDTACEEWRRRAARKYRGGVAQIRVVGYTA